MKFWLKFIAISSGILCLALVLSLLILRHIFPPERIKAIALEKLQTALHRQIRLAQADLGWSGISLQGLEISEEPDFNAGTFLKAQTLRVRPQLMALLQRRIEVADILISGWDCRLIHRKDGTWNFEGSVKPAASAGSPTTSRHVGGPAAAGGLAAWNVGRLRLENGALRYIDNSTGATYALKNIQISTRHMSPKGLFPLDISTDYAGQGLEGAFKLRGEADLGGLQPSKFDLELKELTLKHLGLVVEGSGCIKDLSAPRMSLKASIPSQKLPAHYSSRWPQWLPLLIPIKADIELQKSGDTIQFSQSNPIKIDWHAMQAAIYGWIRLPEKGSPLVHLAIKTGEFSLSDMEGFLPADKRMGLKGRGNLQVLADGPADAPALTGKASLTGVAANYEGQSLSGVESSAQFSPQAISAQAQGNINRGSFHLNLNARNYRTSPDVQLNGDLSELDLAALSKAMPAQSAASSQTSQPAASGSSSPAAAVPIHTSGHFAIGKITHPNFNASKIAFDWDLRNANLPSRITGSAKFNIGPGRFDDLKSLSGSGLVHALLLPITVLQKVGGLARIHVLPAFDRVNFRTITGDYQFQNGLMTIRESHMDSEPAYVTATGRADLARETLDMHISTKLAVQGLSGPISFKVSGTFSNPSVKPDVTSILQQPGINKAVNQGIEQGKKLLQNLFK